MSRTSQSRSQSAKRPTRRTRAELRHHVVRASLIAIPLTAFGLPARLLHPLFSSRLTDSAAPAVYLAIAVGTASLWTIVPRLRDTDGMIALVVLGASLAIAALLNGLFAAHFLALGLDKLFIPRVVLEGPVIFLQSLAAISAARRPAPDIQLQSTVFVAVGFWLPSGRPQKEANPRKRVQRFALGILCAMVVVSPSMYRYWRLYSPPPTSRILASQQSVTGRVVVGEEKIDGHWARYLRVDHSFVGGLWAGPAREAVRAELDGLVITDDALEKASIERAESIYSTFILQEIVRLAKPHVDRLGREERALIIGLGAGLSARALHAHGLNTTICEIDPFIYHYSRQFFGVKPPRGGLELQDARRYVKRAQAEQFDYVVHDVFTGGGVPSSLFTLEAWTELIRIVAPGGIVAINLVGNTGSEAMHLTISTIRTAFAHCRAFSDASSQGAFKNIVLLCSTERPIVVREAIEEDLLKTISPLIRRQTLREFREYEIDLATFNRSQPVRDATSGILDKAQEADAVEHWHVMDGVLPRETWALY